MVQPVHILIVGGGQAGGRAALAARSVDPTARITILAAEAHYPYERPILSKAVLLDPQARPPYVLDPKAAAAANIEVRVGERAEAIDRVAKQVHCMHGGVYSYDKLIIATGSVLRQISVPGVRNDRIHYVRTLDDSLRLRDHLTPRSAVAIIGGGFIGLEVAATARKRGCSASVIEAAPALLSRVGVEELSTFTARHHRADGIHVELGASCVGAEAEHLHLSNGKIIVADVIVAGVGVTPCASLAEAAGIDVDNGVLTDAFGRTSDPDVFAAGDVVNQINPALGRRVRLESWENANLQAAAVGRGAAGQPTQVSAIPWFWSDQGDLNIQIVGHPAGETQNVVRADDEGMTVFRMSERKLVGAVTLNRARDMPLIRRVVGTDIAFDPAQLADESLPLRQILRRA